MKYVLVFFFLASSTAFGQQIPASAPAIQVGYSGELISHPGFQLGVEYPIKDWRKTTRKEKVRQKSWVPHAAVSHIWLIDTRSSTFLEGGMYLRTLKTSGWSRQWSLRLGWAYLENAGTTYVAQEDGSAEPFSWVGNSYGSLTIGHGWSYDLRLHKQQSLALYLQPQVGILFPYNTTLLPFFRLETGIRYYLNSSTSS